MVQWLYRSQWTKNLILYIIQKENIYFRLKSILIAKDQALFKSIYLNSAGKTYLYKYRGTSQLITPFVTNK